MNYLFGNLYPDELLWSHCSRFWYKFRNLGQKPILTLYNTNGIRVEELLPCNLEGISKAIGIEGKTSDVIFREHSLFPLIFSGNHSGDISRIKRRAITGLHTCNRATQGFYFGKTFKLRLCAECCHDDRKTYGIEYWHRKHNIPGIARCHIHGTRLIETDVQIGTKFGKTPTEAVQIRKLADPGKQEVEDAIIQGCDILFSGDHPLFTLDRIIPVVGDVVKNSRTSYLDIASDLLKLTDASGGDRRAAIEFLRSSRLLRRTKASRGSWRPKGLWAPHFFAICHWAGVQPLEFIKLVEESTGPWRCLHDFKGHTCPGIITKWFRIGLEALFVCPDCGHRYGHRLPIDCDKPRIEYPYADSNLNRKPSLEKATLDWKLLKLGKRLRFSQLLRKQSKLFSRRRAKEADAIYHWIRRNAPDELQNLDTRRLTYGEKKVDWRSRDSIISKVLRRKGDGILNHLKVTCVTRKISSYQITGSLIDHIRFNPKTLNYLPRTRAKLEAMSETSEEFRTRQRSNFNATKHSSLMAA